MVGIQQSTAGRGIGDQRILGTLYADGFVQGPSPSGDTSGTTDTVNIQAAINAAGNGTIGLGLGIYYTNATLSITDSSASLLGSGWGTEIQWLGGNTTPVIKCSGWLGGRIANLRIMGQPGDAANKATAAIELNSVSNHVNVEDVIENVLIGPAPGDATGITFAAGVLMSGTVDNDNLRFSDMRINYCDTAVVVNAGQAIDNIFDNLRILNCGTGFTIKAQVTLRSIQFVGSTVTDMDVSNTALVTATLVTSEQSVRYLTISQNSHVVIRGGYFQAGANITGGGDFISGVGNAQDQVVTLEDWQLTFAGGYAGPTPIISLKASPAGSASKVLNLNRVRGIVTAFTEANLDVIPVDATDYRIIQGQVYDGTTGRYRQFVNVLSATTDTLDFTRSDTPFNTALQLNDVQGWTFDPNIGAQTGLVLSAAATIFVCRIPFPSKLVATNVAANLTALAGAGLTHCFLALFGSDGTVIGQTADQAAVWQSGGGPTGGQEIALTGGPFTITPKGARDFLWTAIYVGTAAGTLPQFGRGANIAAGIANIGNTGPRSRYGKVTQADTATLASFATNTITQTAGAYWMAIS